MKTRNKVIIAGVIAMALAGGLVACGHHRSPEARADYMVEKLSDKLELTETQIIQLENLKSEMMALRQSMMERRDQVSDEVAYLLNQPTLDQARVLNLVREHTESINQQAPELIGALGTFYDGLTPAQQTMLREKVQDYQQHRHHWHH